MGFHRYHRAPGHIDDGRQLDLFGASLRCDGAAFEAQHSDALERGLLQFPVDQLGLSVARRFERDAQARLFVADGEIVAAARDDRPPLDAQARHRHIRTVGQFPANPLQRFGCQGEFGIACDRAAVIDQRVAGAALGFSNSAACPIGFRAVGIELQCGLDILLADIGLARFVVNDGTVGKARRVARIDLDRPIKIGKRFVEGFDVAIAEAAPGVGCSRLAIQLDGARKIANSGGEVTDAEIRMPPQNVDLGIPVVEGDGARQILDRIIVPADAQLGRRAAPVGVRKPRVGIHGAGEIADRGVRLAERQQHAPASSERHSALWHQFDGPRIVAQCFVVQTEPVVGARPIGERRRIARCQQDRAIEVADRLFWQAERQQQVAAIVVGCWMFGEKLHGAVEIVDCEFGLTRTGIRDGAIIQDRPAPVVGERGFLERFRVECDRLGNVAAQQG